MFTTSALRRLGVLAIGLALVVPASIHSNQKPKRQHPHSQKSKKEKRELPEGTPVLWQQPNDIGTRDLYWGQGGESLRPDLRKVTLIRKEMGGYSTKYRVRDASGREWVAKIGKEAKGETAASRLMWAVGYHSDINYLVPRVYVEGLNQTLENVRFGLRPKEFKRIDGWNWDHNPFAGSRQFQGLKIMMALLNNWDLKDSNNKILVAHDKKIADKELHYFVADLGGSFGKVSHLPRFLQFKPDRNNPKAYVRSHLVDGVKSDRVDLHFKPKQGHLYKNISVADARWITGWLSRLSNRQIEDAFRAANYSPDEARMLTQGVRQRIRELSALENGRLARVNNHRRAF